MTTPDLATELRVVADECARLAAWCAIAAEYADDPQSSAARLTAQADDLRAAISVHQELLLDLLPMLGGAGRR